MARLRDVGSVMALVADGRGGWFVGGSFASFGGLRCRGLVRVLANGSLDRRWCGVALGEPTTIVRQGQLLYVGSGRYVSGDGWTTRVLRFDVRTRRRVPFPVSLGRSETIYPANVWTIAATSDRVYLGGGFASVGGHDAKRFAALDAHSGRFLFGADVEDGSVNRVIVRGSRVFVFGDFGYVDGKRRRGAAALDAANGRLLGWRPHAPVNHVSSALMADGLLYLGYGFSRERMLVAVDPLTGATVWRRGGDSYPLALVGSDLLIHTGDALVAIEPGSGRERPWRIHIPGNPLLASPRSATLVAVSRSRVAIGGSFYAVAAPLARAGLAELDAASGKPLPWAPRLRGRGHEQPAVTSMRAQDDLLYFSGSFSSVDGRRRAGLAAVSIANGGLQTWNPPAMCSDYGCPTLVAVTRRAVYVTGATVGGKERDLLALDPQTGRVLATGPQPDSSVIAVTTTAGALYIAGCFGRVGGAARPNLAAVNPDSGVADTWTPAPDGCVDTMAVAGTTLYVGGRFEHIAGTARDHVAAFDTTTGRLLPWSPATAAIKRGVYSIVASGGVVYVNDAPLDATTGAELAWRDGPGDRWPGVTIQPTDSLVYIGFGELADSPWGGLIAVSPP